MELVKRSILVLILVLGIQSAYAQGFARPGDWKKYRKEVFVSMGSAHFLGDLGGKDKVGTDFSPVDLDWNQSRTAFGVGYRYKIQRWFNVAGTFNHLIVRGDDAQTQEIFRNNRNLNFKSNIFELSVRAEIGYSSARSGNRYSIKKTLTSRVHKRNWNLFAYTGVGGFYYNPKARLNGAGRYVKLRPLHTEGQGLPGSPKQYSNFSVSIPFGAYYKVTWDRKWSLGIDVCWRKTFTDYIDDVSTSYYDPVALNAAYGPTTVKFADPSKGQIAGFSSPAADGTPAQRGDIEKDSYFSIQLTFGYTFKKTKRKKARLRSKF